MQHLASNLGGNPFYRSGAPTDHGAVAAAIHRITDHGVMDSGTVHPNLMGTTGFQIQLKQRGPVQCFANAIMGLSGAHFSGNRRHLFACRRMAPDR